MRLRLFSFVSTFAAVAFAVACGSNDQGPSLPSEAPSSTAGAGGASGGASGGGHAGTNAGAGHGSSGASGHAGSSGTGGKGGASGGSGGTSAGGTSTGGTTAGGSGGSSTIGTPITPDDPGPADVSFTIDATTSHPISPYVYGTNQPDWSGKSKHLTVTRMGGNRLTAYNWETNASNAGSDYMYENDAYLSSSATAGEAMRKPTQDARDAGASMIMTVPIAGWVSADENGPCNPTPNPSDIASRFFPIVAKKGSAFAYPPDTTDGKVYADEFVAWMESAFPGAQTDPTKRIFYELDNEPDLWSSTHAEIHPSPVTYAELVQKNVDFATAIKDVAPDAIVFGPVNYGWAGFMNLQNAPDANGQDFHEHWLDAMKSAEATAGKRLVDALDVHWYPEAQGDGHRIIDDGVTAGEVEARIQAPRSLWDDGYVEDSWITQCCSNGAIRLLPRFREKIAAHYPGTKIAITEYTYGGGGDISGGIAEADALGIFGREDVFAATLWEMSSMESFTYAAFAMYRNIDGNGAAFGDTSTAATTSDVAASSVYGSFDAADHGRFVVVAINKTSSTKSAAIRITHDTLLGGADVHQLTATAASPMAHGSVTVKGKNAFVYDMPAMSVSTLVFHP